MKSARHPVHVVYGGAHIFRADTPEKLGRLALASFESMAGSPEAFARSVGLDDLTLAPLIHARVHDKLRARAVESMCIDFEDGFGERSDDEEDAEAMRSAAELARVAASGGELLPKVGIRIKALEGPTGARAARTLGAFIETLVRDAKAIPTGFTVTLPKVTTPSSVSDLVRRLETIEAAHGLARIGIELMIESPRALTDREGRPVLGALVAAADGRCVAAHLGAYDFTAELGITAVDQRLDHPACDHARLAMQLAFAGSEVSVYDGATTLLPTSKDADAVHRAWATHARNVRRALDVGIFQGWDLHPAQLPARYGALFAYFIERRTAMAERLRASIERERRATRVGQVFDDAATVRGLEHFFERGVACGALDASELAAIRGA